MKLHNAQLRANSGPVTPRTSQEDTLPIMKHGPIIEVRGVVDDSTPTLESELNELLNPTYGSDQWIKQTESLFDGNIVQTHLKPSKSLIERIKPRSKGRHEAVKPSRIHRARKLFSSIMASLMVEDYSFAYLETVQKTKSAPRHEYISPPKQKYESAKKKRSKLLAPIGAVAFTALALGGGLILKNNHSSNPIEERQKTTQETNVASFTPISVGIAKPAVAIKAKPELAKPVENTPEVQTNPEIKTDNSASFSITIEKGGNIWKATKDKLKETNPNISDPEISKIVNAIIVQNNISNPDIVFAGNSYIAHFN